MTNGLMGDKFKLLTIGNHLCMKLSGAFYGLQISFNVHLEPINWTMHQSE